MPSTPTWPEIIRRAIETRLVDVHVGMPARVEAVHVESQTVDVRPLTKRVHEGLEGEPDLVEELPVIPNIPLAHARGGGAFAWLPVAVGDFVFVVFADRSLDAFRRTGEVSDPGDLRLHGLTGAVALPVNVYPSRQALADAHASNVVVGFDGGAQIHVRPDGEVRLVDNDTAEALALAQKVLLELQHLQTHFAVLEAVITGTAIPEPGSGSPSAFQVALKAAIAGSPYPAPGSVAASKTKGV